MVLQEEIKVNYRLVKKNSNERENITCIQKLGRQKNLIQMQQNKKKSLNIHFPYIIVQLFSIYQL